MVNIYFAHPAFTDAQKATKAGILEILRNIPNFADNFNIYDPFDFSPTIEGDREQKKMLAGSVVDANITILTRSDLVLALIDDRDQGVIWEMGYAKALNLPTITVSNADYDVNVMLSATVMAHVTNVLDNGETLTSILKSFYKARYV